MERILKPKPFYGWIIVAACFLINLNIVGRFYTFSVFFNYLRDDFGWSATAISSISTAGLVTAMLFPMPGAWLTRRYGPRVPIVIAAVVGTATVCLASRANSLGLFCLLWGISGATGMAMPLAPSVPQRWFSARRGLVLAIVTTGAGLAGFIYPNFINWVIAGYGWRNAFLVLGALNAVFLGIAAFVMINDPAEVGLRPYGAEKVRGESSGRILQNNAETAEVSAWTTKEAVRNRSFLLLCLQAFLGAIPGSTITIHFVPFADGIGITRAVAAAAFSTISIAGMPSRLVMGSLAPRVVGWKQGLVICSAVNAAAMFFLMQTRNLGMLWVFVFTYGIFHTMRGPLFPGLIGSYYGVKFLTSLMALVETITWSGIALGPLVAGFIFDRTGSYSVAFLVGAVCWAVATLLLVIVRPPPVKDS